MTKIKLILIVVIMLISGCSNTKNPETELKALDEFWKKLGQNSEKTNR